MKDKIRKQYKNLRKTISHEQVEDWSIKIANNLLQVPIWKFSYYHLFLSIPEKKEVDTQAILHILQGKDKNVVLPKCDFQNKELTNFLLTDSTVIKKNTWGIPEPTAGIEIPPASLEVVFIPLLAFDQKGNRIGYGQGFYDRFLTQCKDQVIKVGLSFFEAREEDIEVDCFDVPLNYCVTPEKIYDFKNL